MHIYLNQLQIVPLRLKIKRKTQDQNMDALPVSSETGSSDRLVESAPNDFIWYVAFQLHTFQCVGICSVVWLVHGSYLVCLMVAGSNVGM